MTTRVQTTSENTITPYGVDPRVHYVTRELREQGFTIKQPNATHHRWTLTDPAGQHEAYIHGTSKGTVVFRAILDALKDEFGWRPSDVKTMDHEASFFANTERREKLRAEIPEWNPEAQEQLVARAKQQLAENQMAFTVEIVDEYAAHRMLMEHRDAAEARGMTGEVDPSLLLFDQGEAFVSQRKVQEAHVDALARAQLRGEWLPHHQGCAFSYKDGRLVLDGQHRLWAIVRSGVPCVLTLARGVRDEAFSKMDAGLGRNAAQMLGMMGVPNPSQAQAAIKLLHYYDNFPQSRDQWFRTKLSGDQVVQEFLYRYNDIAAAVQGGAIANKKPQYGVPRVHSLVPSVLIAGYYVISRAWPQAPVEEFFDSVRRNYVHPYFHKLYPQRVELNSPVRQLVNWSNTFDTRRNAERPGKHDKQIQGLCMLLSAFNATCKGDTWRKPQFRNESHTPVPYNPEDS